MNNLHVKTGDNVMIISGKDKGKTGKVLQTSPKEGKVIVPFAPNAARPPVWAIPLRMARTSVSAASAVLNCKGGVNYGTFERTVCQ